MNTSSEHARVTPRKQQERVVQAWHHSNTLDSHCSNILELGSGQNHINKLSENGCKGVVSKQFLNRIWSFRNFAQSTYHPHDDVIYYLNKCHLRHKPLWIEQRLHLIRTLRWLKKLSDKSVPALLEATLKKNLQSRRETNCVLETHSAPPLCWAMFCLSFGIQQSQAFCRWKWPASTLQPKLTQRSSLRNLRCLPLI